MARQDQVYHQRASEEAFSYSHTVKAGNTLFISGIVSWNENSEPQAVGDMAGQITNIYQELKAILAKHDAGLENLVKETVFTTDIEALMAALPARGAFFSDCAPPASTLVQVERLVLPEFLVEIEFVAVLD